MNEQRKILCKPVRGFTLIELLVVLMIRPEGLFATMQQKKV